MRDPAPDDHIGYEFDHKPDLLLPEAGTAAILAGLLVLVLFIL